MAIDTKINKWHMIHSCHRMPYGKCLEKIVHVNVQKMIFYGKTNDDIINNNATLILK